MKRLRSIRAEVRLTSDGQTRRFSASAGTPGRREAGSRDQISHFNFVVLNESALNESACTWCDVRHYVAAFWIAGWSSLVARKAHNLEVLGSNPSPATILVRRSQPFFKALRRTTLVLAIFHHKAWEATQVEEVCILTVPPECRCSVPPG